MFHGALYTVIWNYIGFECKFKTIGGQLCFTHEYDKEWEGVKKKCDFIGSLSLVIMKWYRHGA